MVQKHIGSGSQDAIFVNDLDILFSTLNAILATS